MKNVICILSLLILVQASGFTQNVYSLENLQKASQEELDNYLNKALKRQKSGKIVAIVGGSIIGATALTIATIAIIDPGDWALAAGAIGVFGGVTGLGTLAVGIPINVSGKKRVKRINSIKHSAFNMNIDFRPSFHYNMAARNYQPCVVLRINF